jgi:hypothetical protein
MIAGAALAALVAAIAVVAVLAGGRASGPGESDGSGAAGSGAAGSGATGSGAASGPVREIIARASELATHGERDAVLALDQLRRARGQYPVAAPLAYAAGRICFSRFYWTEGLKDFRDAIRLDPAYRADPELIKTVLRGFITTPSYHDDLASFLRDDIGSAAQPFLEETARAHPSAMIRSRAAAELRRYH